MNERKLYKEKTSKLENYNMDNSQVKKWNYWFLFFGVLAIEISIATFFKGNFIRHTIGDFFIVILLYLTVRMLTNISWIKAALSVLLFSYFVELLQWVNILELLGVQQNVATDLIIGSTFDWKDIFAYTMGISLVILLESIAQKSKNDKI